MRATRISAVPCMHRLAQILHCNLGCSCFLRTCTKFVLCSNLLQPTCGLLHAWALIQCVHCRNQEALKTPDPNWKTPDVRPPPRGRMSQRDKIAADYVYQMTRGNIW